MVTTIEAYLTKGCGRCERFDTPACSTLRWNEGVRALRAVCLDVGLEETLKWAHPCYVHAGRNVAIIGALKNDFRLSFFDAALMTDPHGVLEKRGANTRYADVLRFTDAGQVIGSEALVREYLAEAMSYAAAGAKPEKVTEALTLPAELVEVLDADPELAEAFHALTPGRQKSYVLHLSSAKKPETRFARIEKARARILAGKGAMER